MTAYPPKSLDRCSYAISMRCLRAEVAHLARSDRRDYSSAKSSGSGLPAQRDGMPLAPKEPALCDAGAIVNGGRRPARHNATTAKLDQSH